MVFANMRGRGSSAQAEIAYLTGYNGSGAAYKRYAPVCWDATASDCKTFTTPVTANFKLFAGITADTVASGDYTAQIIAYGPATVRSINTSTSDNVCSAGASLILVTTKDYFDYGTNGQIGGAQGVSWGVVTLAAIDSTATAGNVSSVKAFVRAL